MATNYDELEKIAELKEKGIITEEEFNEKKSELLNNNSEFSKKEVNNDPNKINCVAKYGQGGLICCNNKIAAKKTWLRKGYGKILLVLTAGLLSYFLEKKAISKWKKADKYDVKIKEKEDLIINIENISSLEYKENTLKSNQLSIITNNGNKHQFYLNEDAFYKIKETYPELA